MARFEYEAGSNKCERRAPQLQHAIYLAHGRCRGLQVLLPRIRIRPRTGAQHRVGGSTIVLWYNRNSRSRREFAGGRGGGSESWNEVDHEHPYHQPRRG